MINPKYLKINYRKKRGSKKDIMKISGIKIVKKYIMMHISKTIIVSFLKSA